MSLFFGTPTNGGLPVGFPFQASTKGDPQKMPHPVVLEAWLDLTSAKRNARTWDGKNRAWIRELLFKRLSLGNQPPNKTKRVPLVPLEVFVDGV